MVAANQDQNAERDINERLEKNSVVRLDELERLRFAKQVMLVLGIICVFVFASYAYSPQNEALGHIFELVKISVPPLLTLVVSFYFPNRRD